MGSTVDSDSLRVSGGELAPVGEAALPAIVVAEGEQARWRFVEFFTANIRNPNTRAAYVRAIGQFFGWVEDRGLGLRDINPVVVAAYIEQHPGSKPGEKKG